MASTEEYSAQDKKDGFVEFCKLMLVVFMIVTTFMVTWGLEALGLPGDSVGVLGLATMSFMGFLSFLGLMIEHRLKQG